MKKIFTSSNVTLVSLYKNILEENDINCIIKNYYLTSGIGDLPANECVPELWILNDDQYQKALSMLRSSQESDWQCTCGEKIDGAFAQCWKCGKVR